MTIGKVGNRSKMEVEEGEGRGKGVIPEKRSREGK